MSAFDRFRSPLRICLIGWGAIATRVVEICAERRIPGITFVAVAVRGQSGLRPPLPEGCKFLTRPEDLAGLDLDLVIEAAGRPAVAMWADQALRHAGGFAITSASALADEPLLLRLVKTADEAGSRLIVSGGALGDLGALAAASLLSIGEVVHRISKPPLAWRGTKAEAVINLDVLEQSRTFFVGSARQAAEDYPQNANVAVISALAGVGLDRTRIELVADPALTRNVHHITASGDFGRLDVRLENEPLKTNPKSSEMAALSLVRLIEKAGARLVF